MNVLHSEAVVYLCLICWLIVALGAVLAVFSTKIRDTLHERVALSVIAIGAAGASYRIYEQGWTTDGGRVLAIGAAYYVITLVVKKWNDRPEQMPADKCAPTPAEVAHE